ncbi:hypothetical protein Tco_0716283 [Tanacetum coccineum]
MISPKTPTSGLTLISTPPPHHQQVHLGTLGSSEPFLDRLNFLLLLHLHPPTRVISQKPQLLQVLQRQLQSQNNSLYIRIDDEDIRSDHIPKVNLKQDLVKPLLRNDRPGNNQNLHGRFII